MQTFRSTVKLNPEIISEYHKATGKLLDAALTLLASFICTCILLPFILPYIPRFSRRSWKILLLPPFAVGFGFYKYLLPHIHRFFLRSTLRDNEKRFRTASPTLESRIEDNSIITRCLETGSEERSPIHGKTVVQTEHYLFIRCSRDHLAIFTIADFSEEVLSDLLSTLCEYGAEIMPK